MSSRHGQERVASPRGPDSQSPLDGKAKKIVKVVAGKNGPTAATVHPEHPRNDVEEKRGKGGATRRRAKKVVAGAPKATTKPTTTTRSHSLTAQAWNVEDGKEEWTYVIFNNNRWLST